MLQSLIFLNVLVFCHSPANPSQANAELGKDNIIAKNKIINKKNTS